MSGMILTIALGYAQIALALAGCLVGTRILRGPRAQDRVFGLDVLYLNAMLLLITYGVQTGRTLYFESALVIAMLGFVGTATLGKFLMRGEVIE